MAVRGVGGGGKASGPKGAGPAAGAGKAAGAFGAKVEKAETLVGPSGAAGSAEAAPVQAADPVVAKALETIQQLQAGQLKSRDEATRKLVADILKEKVRTQSRQLTDWIVDQLKEDPAKSRLLEQLWKRAEKKE